MARYLSPDWLAELDRLVRDLTSDEDVILQQHIDGHEGGGVSYYVTIGAEGGSAKPGAAESPTVAFEQDYETAAAVAQGQLSAEEAFLLGRIRLSGDPSALIPVRRPLAELDAVLIALRERTTY